MMYSYSEIIHKCSLTVTVYAEHNMQLHARQRGKKFDTYDTALFREEEVV